jgi:basic amino acid/polyamine antiporter, APA family
MIGTGVFTSLGFQLSSIHNTWSILLLWLLGGLMGLFGAFAYAELGTHFKESGGDYIYLSRVFHPMLGYLSAWAGITVGFSAPVALAAMAFTQYLSPFGLQNNVSLAILIIILIGFMHSFTLKHSARLQNISTILKVLFLVGLIGIGFILPGSVKNALLFSDSWKQEIWKPEFAVSMVYVSFAYAGWNAAAYVVDEIKEPIKYLPRALIGSTLFVSSCYILFQFVLLKNATVAQLSGREDVAFISFGNLLGSGGGKVVSVFIALQLIATISSYLWVGPRVTCALAQENKLWKPLSVKNKYGIPVAAVWAHVILSILLTLSGSFEKVLQLMACLTVASSLFIKMKKPESFTSPFKPLFQIIFLVFNVGVLFYTLYSRPIESCIGLGIVFLGFVIYKFDKPDFSRGTISPE